MESQETPGLRFRDRLTRATFRKGLSLLMRNRAYVSNKHFPSTEHSYGEHQQQQLQIFTGNKEKTPIVFIHGGGWFFGSMQSVAIGHGHFIQEGYPIFNINYPLAPENPFPQGLISCFKSLMWIKKQNPEIKKVHLVGDSAGGNLAAMMGLLISNPELLATYEKYIPNINADDFPKITSIVSMYAVFDRPSFSEDFVSRSIFRMYAGDKCMEESVPDELRITPLDYTWKNCPPMFLAAGKFDPLAKSSKIAASYFQDICNNLVLKIYPRAVHGFYETPKWKDSIKMKKDIVTFFDSLSTA
ncbi:MAG: hypothetical protein COA99_13870 [Moraxellaceae bacterium]|nr:MAG: hypothetical protein COA99_13870 [Moraxellaceae bacterium]